MNTLDFLKHCADLYRAHENKEEMQMSYGGKWIDAVVNFEGLRKEDLCRVRVKPEKIVTYLHYGPWGIFTISDKPSKDCNACIKIEFEEGQFDD